MAAAASKEKGNAAFKAGDYPAAIGHYTAATIADPSDPTYFLNRAAAYLKLSKCEDAERDCSTVLSLSNNKNVKAFFRRAQARFTVVPYADLQWALKIEPNNDAVKAELVRVDELIVSKKGKARANERPLEPHQLAPYSPHPLTPNQRPHPRQAGTSVVQEAKQTREVSAPKDPAHPQARQPGLRAHGIAYPPSDTAARWTLLNTVPPSSLPTFFRASLEPALLASLIPVLAAAAPPATAREFMCALTRVPRFQTVARFLSASERSAARAVWEAIVVRADDAEDADVAEAARAWGFAEH
ncbi:hypothetical protein EDB84DRAFT_1565920 [Lactarius hengduanensis]|nr:hypothetical protein EDB84DRAFT_1565920 [Lactarius hengduanensis]